MKLKINTALLLTFITHIISAQDYDLQRVSNKSNVEVINSVSNGISVDMFRGTLNCSIPIYEIKGREMNFPISINYTANGIKVNEVASGVGLGWNLNVGGGITRIINAVPDNRSVILNSSPYCHNLSSEASSQVNLIGLTGLTKDFYKVSSIGIEEVLHSQRSTLFLEPMLNENRIVLGDPNTDIKIVDENGTTYYFNFIDSEKNISSSYQADGCQIQQQIYTSFYHLSKIESKNKLDTYTIEYQTFKWSTLFTNDGEGQKIDSHTTYYKMISSSYKLIQKMPKAIYHNSAKVVEFNYGNRNDLSFEEFQGNSLVSIDILKYHSSDISKKIQFNYTYFGANVPTNSIVFNRLKLDKITAIGYDEEQNELAESLYEFNYERPEMVPAINSYAQDYLGLYNGKNNNTNLILNCDYNPNYINSIYDFNPPNSNRSFSFSHSIIGTLNKITFPSKGYVVFEYEQNELDTPGTTIENPSIIRLLDGFRIKSITNYNFDDSFVGKKKYTYLKSKLNETIINGYILSSSSASYNYPSLETHTLSKGYQNPNDLVHYKNVLEINLDSQDNHNGFIQYIFGNEPYGSETEITPFFIMGQIDIGVSIQGGYNYKKFDLLTAKKIYNKNLGLLREENYTYERIFDYEAYNTLGLSNYPNYQIENIDVNDPATRSETILTNSQSSDTSGVFDSKYYVYDEFFHLVEQNKPNENENISYTYTNYPYISTVTSSIKGVKKYIYSNTQFPHLVTEIQQANPDKPLNTVVKFTYDEFGNKVETIQHTPGNLTNASYESYIYGYNNSLPVAKLVGVKYADIVAIHNRINQIKAASDVEISEASEENLRDELNELRRDFPQALVTTYTYDPVIGITSITDSKNYTIYSVYDALGRIKFTKEKDLNGNFNILTEGQYNTLSN
jgi:hypothetical protein